MTGRRRDGETETYTRAMLIERLQDFVIEEGRIPTSRDADSGKHGLPCVSVFVREFGSWRQAVSALGLPTDPRGGHNKGAGAKKQKSKKSASGRLRPTKG